MYVRYPKTSPIESIDVKKFCRRDAESTDADEDPVIALAPPGPGGLLVPLHLVSDFAVERAEASPLSGSPRRVITPSVVWTAATASKRKRVAQSSRSPAAFHEAGLQALDPTPWPDAHRIVAASASAVAIYRALVDDGYIAVRGCAESANTASSAEAAALRCFHHDSDARLERREITLGGTADQSVGYRRQGAREYFQLANLHVSSSAEGAALLASAAPAAPRKVRSTSRAPAMSAAGIDVASLPMLSRIFAHRHGAGEPVSTAATSLSRPAGASTSSTISLGELAGEPFPYPPVRTDADAASVCAAFTSAYDCQDRLSRLLLRFVTLGAALHAYGCAGCECRSDCGAGEAADSSDPSGPPLPAWASRALFFSSGIAAFMMSVEGMLDHVIPPWRVRATARCSGSSSGGDGDPRTRVADAAAVAGAAGAASEPESGPERKMGTTEKKGKEAAEVEEEEEEEKEQTAVALAAAAQTAAASAAAEPPLEPDVAAQVPPPPPGAAYVGPDVFRVYSYWRPQEAPLPGFSDAATGLHADMGLLTVAPRASVPGLVLLHPRTGAWVDVEAPLRQGDFTAFLGEALPRVLAPLMAIARAHAAHADAEAAAEASTAGDDREHGGHGADADGRSARCGEAAEATLSAAAPTSAPVAAESAESASALASLPPLSPRLNSSWRPPVSCAACDDLYGPSATPFDVPRAPLHWVDERRMGWPRISMPFFLRARPTARIPAFPDAAAAAAEAAGLTPEDAATLTLSDTQLWQPLSSAAFDLYLRRARPWRARAALKAATSAGAGAGACAGAGGSAGVPPSEIESSSRMSGGT